MHVLIPAGGRGSRLRPLTDHLPKPLLPLGDRPILTRIVEAIPRDVEVTVLVTPELEPDFRGWSRTLGNSRPVRIYVEPRRAGGLAGPVTAIADCLSDLCIHDDVVVMMGDSVHPFSLEAFASSGEDELRVAVHVLPRLKDASRFGVVEMGPDGDLIGFEEKPQRPKSRWIFTGCLYVPARLLSAIPLIAAGRPPQMGHLVATFLAQGERVKTFCVNGKWHDIGTAASYLEAHAALLTPRDRSDLVSGGNHLDGVVYVHPTAQVSGSRLKNCLVFAGAQITGAELTDCVVSARTSIADRNIRGMLVTAQAESSLRESVLAANGR